MSDPEQQQAEEAQQDAPPPRFFRATLDADGVYQGVEQVDALADGDVEVPADCDLRHGAYRWNVTEGRFDPLGVTQTKPTPNTPTLEQAFYAAQTGDARTVQAWIDYFKTTMDAK